MPATAHFSIFNVTAARLLHLIIFLKNIIYGLMVISIYGANMLSTNLGTAKKMGSENRKRREEVLFSPKIVASVIKNQS